MKIIPIMLFLPPAPGRLGCVDLEPEIAKMQRSGKLQQTERARKPAFT
jgi:hypothetical protein